MGLAPAVAAVVMDSNPEVVAEAREQPLLRPPVGRGDENGVVAGNGADDLRPRRLVERDRMLLSAQHEARPGAAQRLVRGGGDVVGPRYGRRVRAGGDGRDRSKAA